ncbi:MAG TPA: family 16 glycoside hydrolase [Verrucomicrobiae bacterium]|nr:family 16 glycoside hydrolase [Verrucomicrobiae bacterium]
MKLKLIAALGLSVSFFANAAETEEGFKSLFNGKDLSGWAGSAEIWSVKDGAITGVTKPEPKLTHNTFLVYTNGDVADFELRLSYRIVNGNSGIQYRSKVLRQGQFGPIVGGYQADFEAGKRYSGILYEEQGRGILAQRGEKTVVRAEGDKPKIEVVGSVGDSDAIQAAIKNEDWNDYVVIAKGNHLQHFINGKLTVDVTDEDAAKTAKSGVLALQVHVGPPMTVQFKDIRIKTLSGSAQSGAAAADGTWEVASMEANGEALSSDTYEGLKLTVTGGQYSVDKDGEIDRGTFTVDATKSPKQMDIRPEMGPGAGRTVLAIYEFTSKDAMRVCYAFEEGAARPGDFKTRPGTGDILIQYKRK